jgi:hypothetical protein
LEILSDLMMMERLVTLSKMTDVGTGKVGEAKPTRTPSQAGSTTPSVVTGDTLARLFLLGNTIGPDDDGKISHSEHIEVVKVVTYTILWQLSLVLRHLPTQSENPGPRNVLPHP